MGDEENIKKNFKALDNNIGIIIRSMEQDIFSNQWARSLSMGISISQSLVFEKVDSMFRHFLVTPKCQENYIDSGEATAILQCSYSAESKAELTNSEAIFQQRIIDMKMQEVDSSILFGTLTDTIEQFNSLIIETIEGIKKSDVFNDITKRKGKFQISSNRKDKPLQTFQFLQNGTTK